MADILIAESLCETTLKEWMKEHGCSLFSGKKDRQNVSNDSLCFYYYPNISVKELEVELCHYDGLVVRPKEVSAKAIEAADRLQLVVRGGAGVNSIALDAAKANHVVVENTPGENAVSTAEYVMALLFEVVAKRHVMVSHHDLHNASYDVPESYMGRELFGQRLAIVGLGAIGQLVAERASAFGIEVIAYSRSKKDLPYEQLDSIDALLRAQPDIISLHCPLTDDTRQMVSDHWFNRMKPGTVLIDAARPQLIDAAAFGRALDNGVLSSYAIDGDPDLVLPFMKADGKERGVITHHIADSTYDAQKNIALAVLNQISLFFNEQKVVSRVV